MEMLVDWVLPFLIVLTVLIFVHELGHYAVARACGVHVETFSIGFGPELFGRTDRVGTRWRVSAVPLGGYVKMAGEETFAREDAAAAADDPPAPTEGSFRHKTLRQRAAIVAAGPLANIIFAIVVLLGVFGFVGAPAPLAVIGTVQEQSAAEAAGLRAGDVIREIEGQPIVFFEDVRRIVSGNAGVALNFGIERGGQDVTLVATPRAAEPTAEGGAAQTGLLGIRPDLAQIGYRQLSFPDAVGSAISHTWNLTAQIVGAIAGLFSGGSNLDELGGPLRIAQLSGQVAQDGVVQLLYFMAALSVNLALINLLPIPVLDGGHLLLYSIEAVTGKPLHQRIVEYAFRIGIVFVVSLMLLATWNDLINLKVFDFFRRLVS